MPHEIASHIIETTDEKEIALAECMCRKMAKLHGEGCDAPRDVCLLLGFFATSFIESDAGQAITKGEALKVLQRARDAGLVHQAPTAASTFAICGCCPCCCGLSRSYLLGVPQATLKSNFLPEANMELCNGCQSCIKACPTKAITLDRKNKKPVIDLGKCIACGLCVLSCPTENAVKLKRKEKVAVYPRTWDDFLRIRAQQTGRTEFMK